MRKTPDSISKKRQELYRQVRVWEARLEGLSLNIPLTPHGHEKRKHDLAFAQAQVRTLKQALYETQKVGRRFNLDFRKRLLPGVF